MTEQENIRYGFNKEIYTALEAITEAQKIAFAPILFQAIIAMKNHGILSHVDQAGKNGINLDDPIKKFLYLLMQLNYCYMLHLACESFINRIQIIF